MINKLPRQELFATDEDRDHVRATVAARLGLAFAVDIDVLPKNVGVMGDKGVLGHTALISGDVADPAAFVAANADLLRETVSAICGRAGGAVCRVLFDITPGGGQFQAWEGSPPVE